MIKCIIRFPLLLCILAATVKAGPYYDLSIHPSSYTFKISGAVKVAASSATYGTPVITLDGAASLATIPQVHSAKSGPILTWESGSATQAGLQGLYNFGYTSGFTIYDYDDSGNGRLGLGTPYGPQLYGKGAVGTPYLGLNTANPTYGLDVTGSGHFTSSVTALSYYGSGAALTGVIPSTATGYYGISVATADSATSAASATSALLAQAAVSLSNEPTACSAGQYVTDVSSMGVLTCGVPTGSSDVYLASTQTFTGQNTFANTVGIGVSPSLEPPAQLVVKQLASDPGEIAVSIVSSTSAKGARIQFTDAATYNFGVGTADGAGDFTFNSANYPSNGAGSIGTERVRITQTGNVGIGTAGPAAKLTVFGGGVAAPATSGTTPSAGTVARFRPGDNAILDMGGNSTSGFWLQSTDQTGLQATYPLLLNPNGGNVGIGTASPAYILDINPVGVSSAAGMGLNLFQNTSGVQGGILNFRPALGAGNEYNMSISAYSHSGDINTDGLTISGADGVSICTGGNTRNERVRVDASGNVGIGDATPSYPLDVVGDVNITGAYKVNGTAVAGLGDVVLASTQTFTGSNTFTSSVTISGRLLSTYRSSHTLVAAGSTSQNTYTVAFATVTVNLSGTAPVEVNLICSMKQNTDNYTLGWGFLYDSGYIAGQTTTKGVYAVAELGSQYGINVSGKFILQPQYLSAGNHTFALTIVGGTTTATWPATPGGGLTATDCQFGVQEIH